MARPPRDRVQTPDDETARWFQERDQALRRARDDEDAGRLAWEAGTRRGIGVTAQTPDAVRALGAKIRSAQRSAGSRVWEAVREPALQADTVLRSAANTVTFDQADKVAAAANALLQPGAINDWGRRYQADLAAEEARNRYDASHRVIAQHIGQIAGGALTLLTPGGGATSGARLAGAAKLSGREAAALVGGAGAAGAAMQIGSDALTGKQSSLPNTAGAAIGGAANALAMPLGPARAGAVGNAVTSVAQDVFNGRPVSFERAGQGALVGKALGGFGAKAGDNLSDKLPFQAKGRLGEALGNARSTINGTRREWGPKARDQIGEGLGYWYPDGRSGSLRFEDKFGYGAKLTPNQIRAQAALQADFVLYHMTPNDIGRLVSAPVVAAGNQVVSPRRNEK